MLDPFVLMYPLDTNSIDMGWGDVPEATLPNLLQNV
jgi:hypothetical protein